MATGTNDRSGTGYENYMQLQWCLENGHNQWMARAKKAYDYYHLRQWDESDLARMRAEGRPTLTLDLVGGIIDHMIGYHLANRTSVKSLPLEDAADDTADVMDKVWLSIENENKFDYLENDVFGRGIVTGRGFYDVRMKFDSNLQGRVKIDALRSDDVVLDPNIEWYDPDEWPQVFVTRWYNLRDIEESYGEDAADYLRHSPPPEWYSGEDILFHSAVQRLPYFMNTEFKDTNLIRAYRLIDRQFVDYKTKPFFVDPQTGDMAEVPENWDRERIGKVIEAAGVKIVRRKAKTIRWQVSCDNYTLHDADSPYSHFTIVPFFARFLQGETMGIVERLIDPQNLYNKTTSNELHVSGSVANSGWKLKSGSLKGMTMEELRQGGAMTGLIMELDDIQDAEKIQPNSIPQGFDNLSRRAEGMIGRMAGADEAVRGNARGDSSSKAIVQNIAQAEMNNAGLIANRQRSKQLLVSRAYDLVQKFYTETRLIRITQGGLKPQSNIVTINQPTPEGHILNDITQGKYDVVIVPAPSRSTTQESAFEEAIRMRTEVGVAIPDSVLIELSSLPRKSEILDSLKGADSNEQQAQQQQLEQIMMELQQELMQADINKKNSEGELAQSRAAKAAQEATGEDAQQKNQIESERIASSERIAALQARLKVLQEQNKTSTDNKKLAVELTKIDRQPKPQPTSAGKKK